MIMRQVKYAMQERCGSHFSLEVTSIINKGAGGRDIRENTYKNLLQM